MYIYIYIYIFVDWYFLLHGLYILLLGEIPLSRVSHASNAAAGRIVLLPTTTYYRAKQDAILRTRSDNIVEIADLVSVFCNWSLQLQDEKGAWGPPRPYWVVMLLLSLSLLQAYDHHIGVCRAWQHALSEQSHCKSKLGRHVATPLCQVIRWLRLSLIGKYSRL